jgi:galactose mutarotase-like enzyme
MHDFWLVPMFTIARQQKQYETYLLWDQEAESSIEIVPERGGIITHWRIKDQDLLYLDAERFTNPQLSIRGGIPILFPICGNLPDNIYTHQGQQYQLKQHGFARDLPWQVTEEKTNNSAHLTLVLNSNEQTRSVYPFDFQVSFTYQLQGNSLKIQQNYTNLSQGTMPFSTGLHPYFLIPDKQQLEFDIPSFHYQNQITKETFPFANQFDLNQEELDLAFTSLRKHSTSITDHHRQLQIKISYSDLYATLVFWTIKGKDYVCLEPWSAPRNALNTGEKLTYLTPGSSCTALVEMNVSFLERNPCIV